MATVYRVDFNADVVWKKVEAGCCPPGSEPARPSDYKTRGKMIDVDGISCYTHGDGVNAVIVVPDIFGYAAGRIRLITDQLADEGWYAICPKLLPFDEGTDGDGWPESSDLGDEKEMGKLMEWIPKYPWEGNIQPLIMDKLIPFLEKEGKQKISMIGFCWGVWAIHKTCSETDRITCGVGCHPSVRLEGMYGSSAEELAKKVQSPQMMLPAGNDPDNVKPGGDVVKILQEKFGEDSIVVKEFPDMKHGWVPRGDVTDENTKRDVKEAMEMSIGYLHKNFNAGVRCCPPGSEPALAADYQPRGKVEQIGDVTAYTVGDGKNSVICVPDIFGFASGRMRLIADQLADEGYSVVCPKLLPFEGGTDGDGWPESSNLGDPDQMNKLMAWIPNYPWEQLQPQIIDSILPHVEKNGGKIGMIGFCWGSWVIFKTCAASDKIACGVNCHPSVRLEGMFGSSPEELAKSINVPQMMLPAGNDPENIKPGGDVIKVLQEKMGDEIVCKEFPDMVHGWVPRGDVGKDEVARDVKEAMTMGIEFFKKHLS